MSYPVPIIEIAPGIDPLTDPAAGDWQNITSFVIGIPKMERGRGNALDRTGAGSATIRLTNIGRDWEPSNPNGPYVLEPMMHVRIRVNHDATIYPLWRGYIEAWPPAYEPRQLAEVEVPCVDAFKLLSRFELKHPYELAVIATDPAGYWRFEEDAGAPNAADASGNGHTGTYVGAPAHGDGGAFIEMNHGCLTTDGVDDYADFGSAVAPAGTGNFTASVWVGWTGNQDGTCIMGAASFDNFDGWALQAEATGALRLVARGAAGLGSTLTTETFNDGIVRLVTVEKISQVWRIRVNTVSKAANTFPNISLGGHRLTVGGYENGLGPLAGTLDEPTVWYRSLTTTERNAIYASRTGWYNDTPGQRINRILDAVGWPAGLRAIGAGDGTLSDADIEGKSALEHMQAVADSELGLLVMDRNGLISFRGRHDRELTTTPAYTIGNGSSGETLRWAAARFSKSEDLVYNDVQITKTYDQAKVRAVDPVSVTKYGRRSLQRDSLFDSLLLIQDLAGKILRDFKTAVNRFDEISIDPDANHGAWSAPFFVGIGISTRLRLRRKIDTRDFSGTLLATATVDQDVFVEKMSVSLVDHRWRMKLIVSPADTSNYWILGDATYGILGSTTRLSA